MKNSYVVLVFILFLLIAPSIFTKTAVEFYTQKNDDLAIGTYVFKGRSSRIDVPVFQLNIQEIINKSSNTIIISRINARVCNISREREEIHFDSK